MSNLSKYILCIVFGYSTLLFSQNISKEIGLILVLEQLENRFNVKFSYADNTLKSIKVFKPSENYSLKRSLNYLSEQTDLDFKTLTNRFIVIVKKDSFNNIQRLDEILIKNYLTQGLSKSIDGSLQISTEKFGILPGLSEPDIFQSIKALPGIISADERISNLNIRGGTNDQNLVLFNGIRMYQTSHFFGLISAFNPYLTEHVDIVVNGTPSRYGSGVSGLIRIDNSNEITTKAKSGAGFNLISFDGFSKFQPNDKLEFQVSARRSYTDALLTPTYDNYLQRIFEISELGETSQVQTSNLQSNERFFFYDANFKLLYNIDKKNKIRVNALSISNQLDYDVVSLDNSIQESTESELSQQNFAGNIQYLVQWTPNLLIDSQVYFSRYNLFGNNTITDTGLDITQENTVEDFGVRLHVENRLDTNLNLNFGYQLNTIGVSNLEDVTNPNFRRFIRDIVSTHALYSEAEFKSNSKNTFARLGLRGNYIADFKTLLFEPRFSFSQKFLTNFRFKILGEVKNQTISQIIDLQQDFFGIEKRRWQLSNDQDFPIIKSNQISMGLSYKRKGLLFTAEVYNKNVTGINSRTQGFQNQFQLVDGIGNYSIRGIDVLLNQKIENFSAWISYSYNDNDFEFNDDVNTSTFPNNLDIEHVFNISSTFEIENLKLSAGFNWHSGRVFTELAETQFNTGSILFDNPNAQRISNYSRTDISTIYNFTFSKNVRAEVGASVFNIFDNQNIVNRYYSRASDNSITENNEFALGITPNFSFRLQF